MFSKVELKTYATPYHLYSKACETDDTALFDEAVSRTAESHLEGTYSWIFRIAIKSNATGVLGRLLDRGKAFKTPWPTDIARGPNVSIATLEFLLEHRWDINHRKETRPDTQPFMWHVVKNHELVKWCLDHGASVHPRGQEPHSIDNVIPESQRHCEQILEKVVIDCASTDTFELLRSKGAPLGWRPLHLAVDQVTYYAEHEQMEREKPEEKRSWTGYHDRMDMVRYLIDVVKVDVNAPDQPAGSNIPRRHGTPICYIPGSRMWEGSTRELTWLLLDRGADPAPALELAKGNYPTFAEDIEAWKMTRRSNGQKCLVQ